MKKFLFSCAMLAMTAWAANAQDKITVQEATTNMNAYTGDGINHAISTVVDGDYTTFFWGSTAQQVGDYITVNLGSAQAIGNITITFHNGGLDKPSPSKIRYSTDNSDWTDVAIVDISGANFTCSANGATAQYVQLICTGTSGNWPRLAEFEVYAHDDTQTQMPKIDGDGTIFKTTDDAKVTITSEEGATIYYTTDGTEPTTETQTTITSGEQITLDVADKPWQTAITVKAIAKAGEKTASLSASATFYVHDYCMPIYAGNTVGGIQSLTVTGTGVDASATAATTPDNIIGVGGCTDDFFTVKAGTELTLAVTTKNNAWGTIRVYVDKNGNGAWDDDEQIIKLGERSGTALAAAKEGSNTFTIPAETAAGKYLMRVLIVACNSAEAESNDPCGPYTEGGYYDFAFNVEAAGETTGLSSTQAAAFRAIASENGLRVSGVPAGETISVYTVNSVLVATATAAEGVTELAVPAQGVLLVRAGNQVVKVVK